MFHAFFVIPDMMNNTLVDCMVIADGMPMASQKSHGTRTTRITSYSHKDLAVMLARKTKNNAHNMLFC